jgi:N-acetylneuraminate lyase
LHKLKGIFPALLTPFTKDNRIHEKALQQLVRMNLDKGVDGFYVGGSTSEAFLLSMEERKYILDIVLQEVKGRCAVISHIGCIGTDQAIELGRYAEKAGADAISSIPPFYNNFSFDEIKDYYYDIVNRVNLPMIIYNFPAFSGVTLNSENIRDFLCDVRFIGIKHTSSDFYSLERFKQIDRNMLVYNGFDEMFLAGLSMGADGGIGSTYNFMSEKFIKIKRLFEEGKLKDTRVIQTEANDIIKALIKVGILPGEKEILNLMGIEMGQCRKPFKCINEDERKMLKEIVNSL